MRNWITSFAVLAACALAASAQEESKLKVGSEAPAITGLEFVQGELATAPTVRVVEFWATWCPPCRTSIPHINEIYQAYRGRGLEVIGISDEKREKVEPFIRQQGGRMTYTVACDPDKAMTQAFMTAAGKNGIPCAFVIGQTNKIVYIGHPMEEEFARAVKLSLDGRYDPILSKKAAPILEAARRAVKSRNFKDAYTRFDEVIALDPTVFVDTAIEKYRVMLSDEKNLAGAREYAQGLVKSFTEASDAGALRDLVFVLSSDPTISQYDNDLAMVAAEAMAKVARSGDPAPHAALASVWYAKGDFARAVECQRKAVRVADPTAKASFKATLDSYELALKRGVKVALPPPATGQKKDPASVPTTVPAGSN